MSGHDVDEQAMDRSGRRRWVLAAGTLVIAVAIGAYALAGSGSGATSTPAASAVTHATPPVSAPDAPVAPNGTYTTAAGATATIASLRGTTTMVWFVAGGCASCAASIPAVAAHIDQLTGHGLRVLTLGLYGDFAAGTKGVDELLSFGRSAAGFARESITHQGWEWGMASKSLSLAYDPSGIPDEYVLIGPGGHIRYRNSVPDSTMPQLLAQAKRLSTHAQTTAAVEPCC
jgi:hypothetical protein